MKLKKYVLALWQVDKQPKAENNLVAYVFSVAFIVIGAFFVLNLFVGVIISNFHRLKAKVSLSLVIILP